MTIEELGNAASATQAAVSPKAAALVTRRDALRIGALGMLGVFSLGAMTACSTTGAAQGTDGRSPLLTFFVISDTHVQVGDDSNAIRFSEAMTDISSLSDAASAIVVNGDVANSGYVDEFERVNKLANEAAGNGISGEFLWVMGNHDQYTEGAETDEELKEMYQVKYQRFMDAFGLEGCYYDAYIKGYHFIILAPVNTTEGWNRFNIPEEELQWLDDLLRRDEQTGRPAFVFMHEPLDDTLASTFEGSWAHGNCAMDPDALRECIERYPFAVFFSGHTHAYPHYARLSETGPLYAHDGCVKGTWTSKGSDQAAHCGLQVSVYDDGLQIRTRVFNEASWDDDASYFMEKNW